SRAQLENIANDIQCIKKAGTTTDVVLSELTAVKERLASLTARFNAKDVSTPSLGVDAMASNKNEILEGHIRNPECQVGVGPDCVPFDSPLKSHLDDVEKDGIAVCRRLDQLESAIGYDSSVELAEVPSDRASIQQVLTDLTASSSIDLSRIEQRLKEAHKALQLTEDIFEARQQTQSIRAEAVEEENHALKSPLEKLEQLVDAMRIENIKGNDHSAWFKDLKARLQAHEGLEDRFQGHVQHVFDALSRLHEIKKLLVGCRERGATATSLAPGQSQQKSSILLEARAELEKLQRVTSPSMRFPVVSLLPPEAPLSLPYLNRPHTNLRHRSASPATQ
ncbi:hypothetical protein LTR16_006274, partial [Cryomyces antarcticus]